MDPHDPSAPDATSAPADTSPATPPAPDLRGVAPAALTIAGFQRHVAAKYEATDRARGTAATWLWFCEEFGELARALARKSDPRNVEEEFADCVAWLCTLATINDVDLAAAIHRKYLSAEAKDGVK